MSYGLNIVPYSCHSERSEESLFLAQNSDPSLRSG
jgi:hypothetical protein